MATESALDNNYAEFGGIDLRSNDLTRKPRFARSCKNVELLKNNSIACTKGFKAMASSVGGGQTKVYSRDENGITTSEVITIDDNLWRLKSGKLHITYTGAGLSSQIRIVPVNNGTTYTFHVYMYEDGVQKLDVNLGAGKEDSSPPTISSVQTSIDALSMFACTLTGTGSGPAFVLPLLEEAIGSGIDVPFNYWEKVPCPISNPFSTFKTTFGTAGFKPACLFNTSNRFFIATGYNSLYKYDGAQTYRAGVPTPANYAATTIAGGVLTGAYATFVTYEYTDALGNYVEGDQSDIITISASGQKIRHTIPCVPASDGFSSGKAVVSANGTGINVTVTAGHTLVAGMRVQYVDTATTPFTLTEAIVVSVAPTTITLDRSITVTTGKWLTAGLLVNLYRSLPGSAEVFYLVNTMVNDPGVTNYIYDDNMSDATLIQQAEYQWPVTNHGLPPDNLLYLTSFKGGLYGSTGRDDNVFFSDPDDVEVFATQGAFSFRVQSKSNSPIRGLGANREILVVFKENETHQVSGDSIPDGKYSQTVLSDNIGTSSHDSVVDVESALWFYSPKFGPRRIVGNSLPDDVSYRILPAFAPQEYSTESLTIEHSRVQAVNIPERQIVLFFLPVETSNSPGASSFCMAADYRSQFEIESDYDDEGRVIRQIPKVRWFMWYGPNLGAGATIYNSQLVWTEKRYDNEASALTYNLCGRLETNTKYDYTMYAAPIPWEYEAGWTHLGQPNLLKRFIRASIFSFPGGVAPQFDLTCSTEIDYLNNQTHSQKVIPFSVGGQSSGWGSWPWGSAPWGELATVRKRFEFRPTRAISIKLRFSCDAWCQQPLLSGWSFEAVPAFKPRIQR